MDKISAFIARRSGSFSTVKARKSDLYLPSHTHRKPRTRFQVKALFSHCLYRRVFTWALGCVVILTVVLFNPRITAQSRSVFEIVQGTKDLVQETSSSPEITPLQNQDKVDIYAPKQETGHQIKLGVKVDVVEDASNDTPGDTFSDVSNDAPNDTLNGTPDIPDDLPEDEAVLQEEDTGEDKEDTNGPKWLKYKQ